ncbi:MAG TPA: PfkB family carbohydrate kinase [Terriglobia bacterium]|nr:PfkB family carbohydrate kinase [Terriglobia bacterium]
MSVLVVGSVAFDSLKTPYGEAPEILGGAASYFSVAASFFTQVNLVAVVGDDFGEAQSSVFKDRPIDTTGIERASGRTFRWSGEYTGDMSEAKTLDTQLNVFESFAPKIPKKYLESDFVFLANIHPTLQLQVRDQLPDAKLVGLDTMNYWINGTPDELRRTLARVDLLVINDKEARMLAGIDNLRRAAAEVRKMGPRWLVVKRGEFGACLFTDDSIFFVPGYPLEEVHDPTGAGDTFAGGLMGHLTCTGDVSDRNLRRALVYGSVMASFAVEEFGLARLLRLTLDEIAQRFSEFKAMTHFDV